MLVSAASFPILRVTSLRVIGVALALVAIGCGEESATTELELAGFVREAGDGPGVGGATVTFTSDTRFTNSTRTNGDGYYEMVVDSDFPFGQVRAEKDGYQTAEESVFFDTRQRRVDLVLVPSREE